MPKKRVHEIAKELGKTSTFVIEKLLELGVKVKNNPQAGVDDEHVQKLVNAVHKKAESPKREIVPRKADPPPQEVIEKTAEPPEKGDETDKGSSDKERPANERTGAAPPAVRRNQSNNSYPHGRSTEQRPVKSSSGFKRKAYIDGRLYETEGKKPETKPQKPENRGQKTDNRKQAADIPKTALSVEKTDVSDTPAVEAVRQAEQKPENRIQRTENRENREPRQQSDRPPQPRREQESRQPYPTRRDQDGRPIYPPRQGQDGRPAYPPRQGQDGRPAYPPRQGQDGRPSYPPRQGQDGRPAYPPRQGQDGRPAYPPRQGQDGRPFQQRDGGGQRPGGGFVSAPKMDRGGSSKQTEKKPDKNERLKKIQDTKRAKNQERDIDGREKSLKHKPSAAKQAAAPQEPKVIHIPSVLTLKELAEAMNKAGAEVVKLMMKKGKMMMINDTVDFETAAEIALEFNILSEEKLEIDILEETFGEEAEDESLKMPRPPVVVVMGHVDHGKTSLLDAIRNAKIAAGEAGGITQHIGAYTVEIHGKPITFLDTPGHEAFTAMRMRGAKATDIAVLVVAANDGVMPQTIEAISHAKAAGVEIIVAINKIDLPSANPDRVKQELSEQGLIVEEWGGETICVPVSAKTRQGLDNLLEMVILAAELKDYRANPNKRAKGTVIEAYLDKGRGPVATVLVQDGTLEVGNSVVAGVAYGKIRAMTDDKGRKLKMAGPSVPVEILGLSETPTAGDLFHVAINDKQARHVAQNIFARGRVELIKDTPQKVSLDDLYTQIKAGNIKDLNVIVKADVFGSVEALRGSLEKLTNAEVRIRVILGGVGAVTESDVTLAAASGAIIISFNVRPEPTAKSLADEQNVDIRFYQVIYEAIDDIEKAMKGLLDPVYKEKIVGHAQIRQLFKASAIGTIGGCYVTDGRITRSNKIRILRDNVVVYTGSLDALRRFKDDVREVASGYECGMLFAKFNDIKENDIVEAYIMEEIER